jgi:hypothetical protein
MSFGFRGLIFFEIPFGYETASHTVCFYFNNNLSYMFVHKK